jgi:hypothetical protein
VEVPDHRESVSYAACHGDRFCDPTYC